METGNPVKIVTWNVNSIGQRLERLLGLLTREAPDFVCLQELKCVDEKFPLEAIRAAGYHAIVHGQKAYNGVAILCREAPTGEARGFSDGGDDTHARFVSVRHADLTVMCGYIPNGQSVGSEKYVYKLEWLKRLRAYLDRNHKPTERLCLVGDFNVAPTDLDVHDPAAWHEKILCSTAERAALEHITAFGLSDVYRTLNPDVRAYSWWDYRGLSFPKNLGLRIDLVLATAPLAARCREVRILRDERKGDKASDHAPVSAEFTTVTAEARRGREIERESSL